MSVTPLPRYDAPDGPHLHTPFLERASQPGNRERAHALGAFLTLRAVDRISEQNKPVINEAQAYQLRAAANYLEELHPQTKDVSHLREIIRVAQRAVTTGNSGLIWAPMLAFAYWLESELRLSESLDVLETTLRLRHGCEMAEEIAAYLQQGRVLRHSGRYVEARAAYVTADEIAGKAGDFRSQMVSRIGRATILQKVGDLPGSERELNEILGQAREFGDEYVDARARHALSVSFHLMGKFDRAVAFAFEAYRMYEEPGQQARALGDTAGSLKELGHYSAARQALQLVLGTTPAFEVRFNTMLELLELSALTQDRVGFERWRRELDQQRDHLLPEQRAEFHLKVGIGLGSFEMPDESAAHLQAAVDLSHQYRLGQRLFEAESAMSELQAGKRGASGMRSLAPEPPMAPETRETVESLFAIGAGY